MHLQGIRKKIALACGVSGLALGFAAAAAPVFDGDKDGVPDERDLCLFTSAGQVVQANGCARTGDADRDGVDDAQDRCPRSPAGAITDIEGCSRDADIDGIADGIDRCADTPLGYMVDALGCTLGQTPGPAMVRAPTPSTPVALPASPQVMAPATAVPQVIPATSEPPIASAPAALDSNVGTQSMSIGENAFRIQFRRYSALLGEEAQATLQTFASRAVPVLERSPAAKVVVTGAISEQEVGEAAYRLGVGRALTVKAFLRSVGIDKHRIQTPEASEQRAEGTGSADIRLLES